MGYCCDTCGKTFSTKSNMRRHIKERHVSEQKYFVCTEKKCDGLFVRQSYLRYHLERKHGHSASRAKRVSGCARLMRKKEWRDAYYSDVSSDESFFEGLVTGIIEESSCAQQQQFQQTQQQFSAVETLDSDVDHVDVSVDVSSCNFGQKVPTANETQSACVDDGSLEAIPDFEDYLKANETASAVSDGTILQDEHGEAAAFVSEPDTVNDSGFADNEAAPMDEDFKEQVNQDTVDDGGVANDESAPRYEDVSQADDSDDVIIIDDVNDEDQHEEYVVSSINLTLQRTIKLVNGNPTEIKRTASIGYSETIDFKEVTPWKLFEMFQDEFKHYASQYHDNK
ncbi:hypothetical protein DPMN_083269 [Dreissena polymorpha]|uniref:C2H2-type domain-containing protein n=1 Tax=Dreissena polymorpha TaxID=45954 RepID=A0A9D3Y911_DREPO|nr:hypothetical protein DPMN_083269 [Dreissena polymorpha]